MNKILDKNASNNSDTYYLTRSLEVGSSKNGAVANGQSDLNFLPSFFFGLL